MAEIGEKRGRPAAARWTQGRIALRLDPDLRLAVARAAADATWIDAAGVRQRGLSITDFSRAALAYAAGQPAVVAAFAAAKSQAYALVMRRLATCFQDLDREIG